MPPKAAKRKAKSPAGDDEDLWDLPGDQPRKRTRTSVSRLDDASEDTGKKATKQFQSWAQWQKRFNDKEKDDKRQFAGTFKQNIEKNREVTQMLINQSNESLNMAGKKRAELLRDACTEIEPAASTTPNSKKSSPNPCQDLPLFKAGQELFKKCRDLVAVHEQANNKASAQGNTHTSERRILWKADLEQVQKALMYAAQYSEKVIQCNVDMSSNGETKTRLLSPPRDVLNGPGQMALDMHQRSIEKLARGGPTWGEEALKYIDKFAGLAAMCEREAEDV